MAEQCNGNAIATHTSTAKWWPDVHASSICSWTTGANYATNPPNPSSNCSGGEEDVSMSNSFTTNASNNSGLSMESSRRLVEKASVNDPYGEAVSDNHHLWNQVLLSETTGELQHISTRMYEPACDYLKKIDSSSAWEFSSPTNPEISPQFNPQYNAQFAPIKNEHVESDIEHEGLFRRGLNTNDIGYQGGVSDMVSADNNKYCNNYNGTADIECANGMGFVDLVAFGSYLNKAPSESQMSYKSIMNAINLPDRRDPVMHNSYQPVKLRGGTLNNKVNGRGNGVANEGKRKKSEDQSGSTLKKTKLDHTSTVSSTNKIQVPKAKLGDKITVLQQIVSPFGKTDTASVLWEAIGYIRCLQEQVQLLSNPYMKTNIIKDPWVRLETKDRGVDTKIDLKSRGLCLVPVSCTPQVYHENTGSDYWTPTYRGFYRS